MVVAWAVHATHLLAALVLPYMPACAEKICRSARAARSRRAGCTLCARRRRQLNVDVASLTLTSDRFEPRYGSAHARALSRLR